MKIVTRPYPEYNSQEEAFGGFFSFTSFPFYFNILMDTFCRNWKTMCLYIHRNLFGMLLSQTMIRLYLSFFDWIWTKRNSVWFQINRIMINTIWFWLIYQESESDFSVRICLYIYIYVCPWHIFSSMFRSHTLGKKLVTWF